MRITEPGVYRVEDKESLPADPAIVIDALTPMITEARRKRIDDVVAHRVKSVVAVLDGVWDPHNASAILRSADAFGVQEVHVVEAKHGFLATERISKKADQWLDVVRWPDRVSCAHALHANGFQILIATMDGTKTPDDLALIPRAAIVLGNEQRGISPEILSVADATYRIPMVGFVESLNVSVAAGITLSAATRGRKGDLTEAERTALTARLLMRDVRDAARIVEQHRNK